MDRSGSDTSLEELVREHAALQRVAILGAREPSPAQVFEAVAREVGTLLHEPARRGDPPVRSATGSGARLPERPFTEGFVR